MRVTTAGIRCYFMRVSSGWSLYGQMGLNRESLSRFSLFEELKSVSLNQEVTQQVFAVRRLTRSIVSLETTLSSCSLYG